MSAPRLSAAEWRVMQVIWAESPITAREIVDRLEGKTDWHPRTIKTMLNRLVKKGALAYEAEGNRYLYRPRVPQEKCVRQESEAFRASVFQGMTLPMIVHFVENARLNKEQIDTLRRVLDAKGK